VDVRVLTNGPHIDKQVVRQAGHRSYQRLLDCGVRVFEYQRTMLHAKTLLVDDQWATVGSINFDNRSFALNDELNISFRDPGLVATLEKHFFQDLEDARELEARSWRARPLTARAREVGGALLRWEL
jgi:cardiolipin synthase